MPTAALQFDLIRWSPCIGSSKDFISLLNLTNLARMELLRSLEKDPAESRWPYASICRCGWSSLDFSSVKPSLEPDMNFLGH